MVDKNLGDSVESVIKIKGHERRSAHTKSPEEQEIRLLIFYF